MTDRNTEMSERRVRDGTYDARLAIQLYEAQQSRCRVVEDVQEGYIFIYC